MISDHLIRMAIGVGDIVIDPLPTRQRMQPVSVDLTLGEITEPCTCEDHGWRDDYDPGWMRQSRWTLKPGEFRLASTAERIELSREYAALVVGKSSLARLGLWVEGAGLVDPGFQGQITLELSNLSCEPIELWPGMRICQITFDKVQGAVLRPYGSPELGSHFQGQMGPTTAELERPPGDDSHLPPTEEAESNR